MEKKSMKKKWILLEEGTHRETQNMLAIKDADGRLICDFGNDINFYPTEGQPPVNDDLGLIAKAPDMYNELLLSIEQLTRIKNESNFDKDLIDQWISDREDLLWDIDNMN